MPSPHPSLGSGKPPPPSLHPEEKPPASLETETCEGKPPKGQLTSPLVEASMIQPKGSYKLHKLFLLSDNQKEMFKRRRHKFFLEIMEAIVAYQKREGVYLANSIDNRVNFYQPYLQRSIWNSRKWIMKLHALKTKFNSDSAPNEDVEKKEVELWKKIWG
ncbi:hypothetical protein LXL04_006318 [Taraxacum kok-saghyz]